MELFIFQIFLVYIFDSKISSRNSLLILLSVSIIIDFLILCRFSQKYYYRIIITDYQLISTIISHQKQNEIVDDRSNPSC